MRRPRMDRCECGKAIYEDREEAESDAADLMACDELEIIALEDMEDDDPDAAWELRSRPDVRDVEVYWCPRSRSWHVGRGQSTTTQTIWEQAEAARSARKSKKRKQWRRL